MKISKEQQSVIAIAGGLFFFAWFKHSYYLLIAGSILLMTLPFTSLCRPIHRIWMGISTVLAWISSHIILSIIFYLFLTPISLLRRFFRTNKARHETEKERTAFYQRNYTFTSRDFLNPW